jgi:sugar transferase EpsL
MDTLLSYQSVKRAFDFIVAVVALSVLLPIFTVISCLIVLFDGLPLLFCQQRPGLHGKPFVMYKFRTMNNLRDSQGVLLPDNDRLTPLGRVLRSYSLDELPGLINVIRGEMSLVGPRPLLVRYLDRYTPEQMHRHEVKPGITGWSQVNGRNALTWEQKFTLDVWYVDHQSIWLDIRILLLTALKVLRREGINAEGDATMPEFMGTGGAVEPGETQLDVPEVELVSGDPFARGGKP